MRPCWQRSCLWATKGREWWLHYGPVSTTPTELWSTCSLWVTHTQNNLIGTTWKAPVPKHKVRSSTHFLDDFFPFLAFFRYATWNIKKTTVLTDQHASLLWKETLFLGRKVCTTWHSLRSTHSSTVPLTSHRGPATTTQLCVCVLLLHSLEKSHFGNRIAN